MLTERLHQRQVEKEELETQLAIENNKKICLSEAQILAFLDYVCEMPLDDFNKRRAIINIFVHSIYLYDDHFTLIINASKKPLSIENIPLDDIEEAFEGENTETEGCSSLMTPAPPRIKAVDRLSAVFICIHKWSEGIEPHCRCCGGLPQGRAATDIQCGRLAKQANEAKRSAASIPSVSATRLSPDAIRVPGSVFYFGFSLAF